MAAKNAKLEVKGHVLTITVDLSKDFGPSASGKTTIVSTTGGGEELDGGIKVNLTVYKKVKKAD